MFANRITQQIVRSGKDIKSDRDILEEELIQPMQPKENVSSTTAANASVRPTPEDLQHAQTREQPSAAKLLEFKQQMHTEKNYRSIHRNDLAKIARKARTEEQTAQSDLFENSAELKQNNLNDDNGLAQTVPETTNTKPIHKPIAGSQQEENILDDENIFEPRRTRTRERHANKVSIPRANTPTAQRLYTRDLGSTLQTNDANLKPIMQFCVCKVCGNIVSDDQNQSKVYSQQVSGKFIHIFFSNL
jgi:rubrerythrin